MKVETRDYDGIKERVFRGKPQDILRAAAEFVNRNDVEPRSIQAFSVTAETWRISIFYKEI